MRVEAPGFELAVREVKAEVGRVTRADVSLQVGVATEAITIRDDEIRVNTAQSSLQGIITQKQIRNLPLNGRNFLELGQLEPGVQINNSSTLVGVEGYNTAYPRPKWPTMLGPQVPSSAKRYVAARPA